MPRSENAPWDAIVVGASFGGLAFASGAAARGLRVLVLERDPAVGGVVRTTGVLFSDVLDLMDVPQRYLMNSVRRMEIHAPGHPSISVGSDVWRFYMADVTGMLQWMADAARDHGATIRCGAMFADVTREPDGRMRVSYTTSADGADHDPHRARTNSHWRGWRAFTGGRRTGLDQNTAFLAGAEWLVEGVALSRETFYLVMDHDLAPGYCVWLAPHSDIAALGVAGHSRAFKPGEDAAAGPIALCPCYRPQPDEAGRA